MSNLVEYAGFDAYENFFSILLLHYIVIYYILLEYGTARFVNQLKLLGINKLSFFQLLIAANVMWVQTSSSQPIPTNAVPGGCFYNATTSSYITTFIGRALLPDLQMLIVPGWVRFKCTSVFGINQGQKPVAIFLWVLKTSYFVNN